MKIERLRTHFLSDSFPAVAVLASYSYRPSLMFLIAQYFFSLFMASFIFYAQYSYLFQPSEEGDPQNTPTYRGRPSRSPRNMT